MTGTIRAIGAVVLTTAIVAPAGRTAANRAVDSAAAFARLKAHLDGADLILTHYCIAKNQPTLRAERFDPVTSEIQFEFVRASSLATPGAGHMRRAKFRFQDPDHFVTEWEYFQDGKRTMAEVEAFSRQQ